MPKPLAPLALLAMATALPVAAISATAPTALDRVLDCTLVTQASERLACFDREVGPLALSRRAGPASPEASVAPSPAAAPAPGPEPGSAPPTGVANGSAQQSFGEEQLLPAQRQEQPEEDRSLHAAISEIRKVGTSQFLLTLDNGQIWRHEDQFRGSFLREGDAITISKGAMASYRLTRDAGDSRTWIRVMRVR